MTFRSEAYPTPGLCRTGGLDRVIRASRAFVAALVATFVAAGCGVAPVGTRDADRPAATLPEVQPAFGGQGQMLAGAPGGEASWLRLQDGTQMVVVASDRPGDRHLSWASSADGRIWTSFVPFTSGALTDVEPVLFASARGVECVFASNRWLATYALYRTSFRAGRWSEPVRLELGVGPHRAPAVVRAGDRWLLAWQGPEGVSLSTSVDGVVFPQGRLLLAQHGDPAIAAVGDRVVVVAHQRKALFSTARDAGVWSTPVRIPLPVPAWSPALSAAASDSVALAYATAPSDQVAAGLGLARWSEAGWSDLGRAVSSSADLGQPAWCAGAQAPFSLLLGMELPSLQQALVRVVWSSLPEGATASLPTGGSAKP
ncbi:MAG: hypothetical protein FJY99_02145 [Candidatus Sericytochromatia bacterium]|nr:hypothetical protein [Candidatus Tanganyikabacteria bacterium]